MAKLNVGWEELLESSGVVSWDSKPSAYIKINYKDPNYDAYSHCCHVLIYAKTNTNTLYIHPRKAIILMQVRFDGFLGFPGGFVDQGENPIQALNRELREESGWTEVEGPINESHHLFTHFNKGKNMVLNFFAIEVNEEKIKQIELSTLHASDYGEEVLGTCRVPLYTLRDGYRGFPSFLHHNFVGNAKVQLIEALVALNFMSAEDIIKAIHSKPLIIA